MNIQTITFDQLPEHDACWSFIKGVDGKLYTGVCGEMTGGLSACVAGYDPRTEKTEYLVDMADALGVPPDNGEGTQSKVHYCLLQDDDGTLYAATHCTGAPLGDWIWRPWNCWNHPRKHFRGSGLVAFRPDGEILYSKILFPHEGSRCMALAPKRRNIYGISYPRNRFFVLDLKTREVRDKGRLGNLNPQCIFVDGEENAYTTDDYGMLVKYCADRDELTETGVRIPHAEFRNGYHNTLYDAVPTPDGEGVFGVTWNWGQRLFRYDFKTNRLTDYGRFRGEEPPEWDHIIHDHAGGLVVGGDGRLYAVVNRPTENGSRPFLFAFDPETERREELGPLHDQGKPCDHISRGAMDDEGNLYFAEAGASPCKLFRCRIDYPVRKEFHTRRLWG